MRAALHIIVLALAFPVCGQDLLYAQPQQIQFERLDSRDGLSHNTVLSILQDRTGYLWVGTVDGLNRYDGYEFVVYRHDRHDSTSLPGGNVNALLENPEGQLWVGTARGLSRLDRDTGRFVRYQLPSDSSGANVLALGAFGDLWVWTRRGRRLYRCDRQTTRCRSYQHQPGDRHGLGPGRIGAPVRDDEGMFVGILTQHDDGTVVFNDYDARHDRFHRVELPGKYINADVPFFPQAYRSPSGVVWMQAAPGSHNAPMERVRLFPAPSDGVSLRSDHGAPLLREDQQGRLWIGTHGQGLYRYDPATETLQHHLVDPSRTAWLNNTVQDIYEDRAGTIWIGTLSGLYRYDPHRKPFTHFGPGTGLPEDRGSHTVMTIHEETDGVLWAGTLGGGLLRIDHANGSTIRYDQCGDLVWTVHEDRAGTLWIIGDELCALDRQTGRFTRYGSLSGLPLAEDQAGHLWVTRNGRLHRRDPDTGVLQAMADKPPGTLTFVHVDRSGTLWIGRENRGGGLICFHPETSGMENCQVDELSEKVIRTLHEDEKGMLWLVASRTLFRLDPSTRKLVQAAEPNLLPGTVYSILEDDQERLWMGTSHGIARFDKRTGRFRHYDANETGITEFNRRAAFRSPRGAFLFGGLNGITAFYPEAIEDNPSVPPIVITRIQKANRDTTQALNPERAKRDGLVLGPHDYSFSFEFAALNFTLSQKNRYRYKLDGVDEDWVEAGTRRFARYVGVPPGRYVFRVRGSNNDGVWNEEGTSVRVVVLPPFWQTWWFRLLAAGLIVGLLTAAYRYRVGHLLRLERLRMRIAGDLHDDIGSKLSSIALMSEMVTDQAALKAPERQQLTDITDLARHMVEDLRDIVWMINPRYDRLENLVSKMQHQAATLLKDIRHTFHAPPDAFRDGLDMDRRRHLYLMYKETLHNVARHAHASHVDIHIARRDGTLEVVVQDDGVGFDPAVENGGHGLASLRERARLADGSVAIESNPGKGTTVRITARIPEFRDGRWKNGSV